MSYLPPKGWNRLRLKWIIIAIDSVHSLKLRKEIALEFQRRIKRYLEKYNLNELVGEVKDINKYSLNRKEDLPFIKAKFLSFNLFYLERRISRIENNIAEKYADRDKIFNWNYDIDSLIKLYKKLKESGMIYTECPEEIWLSNFLKKDDKPFCDAECVPIIWTASEAQLTRIIEFLIRPGKREPYIGGSEKIIRKWEITAKMFGNNKGREFTAKGLGRTANQAIKQYDYKKWNSNITNVIDEFLNPSN